MLADIQATAGTADGSVRKIAARHGVGMTSVRRIAEQHGMSDAWAGGAERVHNANVVKAATVAQKRADLQMDLLDDAQELRERLFADVIHLNVVKVDMHLEEVQQTQLPAGPGEWRNTMTAIGIATDKAIQIAKLENEQAHTGQVSGLLEEFVAALKADLPELPDEPEAAE